MSFPRIRLAPRALFPPCLLLLSLLLAGGCAPLHEPGASAAREASATAKMREATDGASPSSESPATTRDSAAPPAHRSDETLAAAETHPPTDTDADADADADADLWQRLRGNFRLSDQHQNQRRLQHFEQWYSSRPRYFERLIERAKWFLPYVLAQVEQRGMPAEIALLPAIESAFRPSAVSRARAVGMWQFIAATGRRYDLRQDWWVDERKDLTESTRAALDYLQYLQREFDGDWELALAAYNSGEGNVRRHVRRNRARNQPTHYAALKLRRETADYVPKLLALRNLIAAPRSFGIALPPLPNRATLAVIETDSQTDLAVAASLGDLSGEQLRYFNQGYKRGVTSPQGPHRLVVPVEIASHLRAALAEMPAHARLRWARHRVREGEYLGKIARQYGVTVDSIIAANNLRSSLIHPRQALRIPLSTGRRTAAFATASAQPNDSTKAQRQVHLVVRGDSLWRIARRYGVSVANLARWNRISQHDLLHPGQPLVVKR
ncbi:MAG: LysM peptidoglycan-binding domain-containing protein [bacterium]